MTRPCGSENRRTPYGNGGRGLRKHTDRGAARNTFLGIRPGQITAASSAMGAISVPGVEILPPECPNGLPSLAQYGRGEVRVVSARPGLAVRPQARSHT